MFQPKQRVGEYVLDECVGQNAYAEAWRAHHHMWADQEALVKIPTNPEYVKNLRQDGIRVQRLVHPNIIRPIGFDPNAEPPYLITEYLKGESLRARITGKRLSIAQSVNILRHVLEALQFGHERQVVHGDIKPENILLDAAGETNDFAAAESVKVTDFGVGLAAAATLTHDAAAKAQAQTGSLAYVPPEQRDGAAPDAKSDIYAVGVVLFEMLTGERPTGAELPSELNPEVQPWLDDIFKKSYARRERRFDSAKVFLEAMVSHGSPAAPAAPPPSPAPAGIRIRQDPEPGVVSLPPKLASRGSEIRLASDNDSPPPSSAPAVHEMAPEEIGDVIPMGRDEDEPLPVTEDEQPAAEEEPVSEEEQEEQQEAGADTATTPEEQVSGEPIVPVVPRVASPADRNAIFDELSKRQVRTPDDLRASLKGYFEMRDMDQGESANIRLRLMKWGQALAGGKTEMDEQILLINAAARPLYIIKYLLRSTRGDEPMRSQTLEHPIGAHASQALRAGDYRLVAHFSSESMNEKILESIASAPLRTAVTNMTREAKREFFGRIQRQDLMIFRANIITTSYRFDQKKYRAFLVGNSLSVVSSSEPFTKIRQEPTKRAATLLNGEQIFQGIKELRRGLDDRQWEGKANVILSALRGKLAAAYMVEAKAQFKTFGWLESLEQSAKAGQLAPGNEDALSHAAMVRKRIGQLQLLPGTIIAVVLMGLSVLWTVQSPDRQAGVQPFLAMLFQSSLFFAGIAAWIATLWSKAVLKSRMSRTDFAFYQAAIFPLIIALIIAFVGDFRNLKHDGICAALLAIVIVADVMVFKKLRKHLIRRVDDSGLIGDGLTVLSRIESMLGEDWEVLRPHYLELGPLFSYTTVQSTGQNVSDLFQAPADSASSDETVGGSGSSNWTTSHASSEDMSTGNPELDKLVSQMNARISANLRTLAPSARTLVTLFNEYAKSVSSKQLGMMQTNAAKIEQKGKDLSAKLADFDRLCRSPLPVDSGANADMLQDISSRLAERSEDPDIKLIKSLAERAKAFREDQANAAADITAIIPEVEEAIERMKKG